MPNYFYSDANGQKQGPLTSQQLQTLATQGIITPDTPLVTDGGHRGKAGQIRGLFSAMTPSPFTEPMPNQSVSQSVPTSAAKRVWTPYLIITVGVLTLLVVGGIVWSFYPHKAGKPNEINIFDRRNTVDRRQHSDTDDARRVAEALRRGFGVPNSDGSSGGGESRTSFTAAEQIEIDKFLTEYGNEFGNNVKTANKEGTTLLHIAAHNGDFDAVRYCIQKGANVNAKNKWGSTPLHLVAGKGDEALLIVFLLITKDADILAKNNDGDTPLDVAKHWDARATNYSKMAELLSNLEQDHHRRKATVR